MFKDTPAFSGFSVDDIAKAEEFYGQTLGLEVVEANSRLRLHIAGGNPIVVFPKPNHVPATFSILNFPVAQIEAVVVELTKRGVTFEQYSGDVTTDAKGIAWANGRGPNIAWFKDPAGNILAVIETA